MLNVKLTKNFNLKEFLRSSSYPNLVQVPNSYIINCLKAFCINVLQPLRDFLGSSVRITSGWRNKDLNKAVGGVKDSTHQILVEGVPIGVAADISTDHHQGEVCKFLYYNTPATTIIYYPNTGHIHVGIRNNRRGTKTLLIKIKKGYEKVNVDHNYDWSKLGDK